MRLHKTLILVLVALATIYACGQRQEIQSEAQTPAPKPAETEAQRAAGNSAPSARAHVAPGAEDAQAMPLRLRHAAKSQQQMAPATTWRLPNEALDREVYAEYADNPVRVASEHPVSTFSIDVDTGAYANVRRFINGGRLPHTNAVRVEEMINYFKYAYPAPPIGDDPFSIVTEIGATPWNRETRLLHIGIQGRRIQHTQRPPSNLVFLLDVSGSMRAPDKLPLLKNAMKLLARQLRAQDRVAIVVYAGASGVALEPVAGDENVKIERALERLSAGGSTNGGSGIRLAYSLARQSFIHGGINRVILATDGDFNVGTVDFSQLKDLVKRESGSGITLTTLGFGGGNYNDRLLEQIADLGNGNYAYIDTLREAHKVLVEELGSTLQIIAKDVKIQIEFNPQVVAEYRLIGYENRILKREDFNNDKVDAGDIGAGHSVTALYEITLRKDGGRLIDPLRYQQVQESKQVKSNELAFLRLRYKKPAGAQSNLIEHSLLVADIKPEIALTSTNFRFAAAVAAFGQILRGGRYTKSYSYTDVLDLARTAINPDTTGYRAEFLGLVRMTRTLDANAMRN